MRRYRLDCLVKCQVENKPALDPCSSEIAELMKIAIQNAPEEGADEDAEMSGLTIGLIIGAILLAAALGSVLTALLMRRRGSARPKPERQESRSSVPTAQADVELAQRPSEVSSNTITSRQQHLAEIRSSSVRNLVDPPQAVNVPVPMAVPVQTEDQYPAVPTGQAAKPDKVDIPTEYPGDEQNPLGSSSSQC
jgi:hypothetical protein